MSRRLILLIVIFILALPALISAQDVEPSEVIILTEDQINAEFTIPSTRTHRISNVVVDVQDGEVHVSFDLRDGTSNTMSIIAILIGVVQGNSLHITLTDVIISSASAPPRAQQEIARLVIPAWRSYLQDTVRQATESTLSLAFTRIEFKDDSIVIELLGSEASR